MLMECLAADVGSRCLPQRSTQLAARTSGLIAGSRKQFNMPMREMEEEPLARIAAHTYMVDAARKFSCAGVRPGRPRGAPR